jgi:hypothetical protein
MRRGHGGCLTAWSGNARRRLTPHRSPDQRPNRLRAKTIFARRISPITPVKPSPQKYFCFFFSEIDVIYAGPASA